MDHQTNTSHHRQLAQLQASLAELGRQTISSSEFCRIWRSQAELLAALPLRYAQVQEDLLSRLEAGSLFSEESCSFSQGELVTQLDMWLSKAMQQLEQA
ncbi:hypothetical protein [Undibacterium terreum]|nr:hypothetical protein [Undibacterium terreum]